jgi:adenosylcobinamide kinase / adenosylcobinamide-phosphate guanylyltransferase
MKKIIFITGAVRSGKSSFSVEIAKKSKKQVIFLATCKPSDGEMKIRVKKHQQNRPSNWQTIEENLDISSVFKNTDSKNIILIDCITLWISNLLLYGLKEKDIFKKVENFITTIKETDSSIIIVSNEVGWGIVPENKLARTFRDIIGITHQKISQASNEVFLMVSGIPMKIK